MSPFRLTTYGKPVRTGVHDDQSVAKNNTAHSPFSALVA
jgi:hypothetical protein